MLRVTQFMNGRARNRNQGLLSLSARCSIVYHGLTWSVEPHLPPNPVISVLRLMTWSVCFYQGLSAFSQSLFYLLRTAEKLWSRAVDRDTFPGWFPPRLGQACLLPGHLGRPRKHSVLPWCHSLCLLISWDLERLVLQWFLEGFRPLAGPTLFLQEGVAETHFPFSPRGTNGLKTCLKMSPYLLY